MNLVKLGDFFLLGDVGVKVGTDFESIPLEKIVDETREEIWLLRTEESSSYLIESTSQVS